jgi:hypothetical protein
MPAPADLGLTGHELDAIDRATQWIAMGNAAVECMQKLIISSLSDPQLALKVAAFPAAQTQSLVSFLRDRRKKA